MNKSFFLFAFILAILTIVSCKDNSSNPPVVAKTHKIQVISMSFTVPEEVTEDNLGGLIWVAKMKDFTNNIDTLYPSVNSSFGDYFLNGVDAGDLKMNGIVIPKIIDRPSGGYPDSAISYILTNGDISINSTPYNFTASGGILYPSFSIGCVSPKSPVDLTSPSVNQTVSRSKDLNITWSGIHDTTQLIGIIIRGKSDYSIELYPSDTGEYTISSADLSGLEKGQTFIEIICANYTCKQIAGGKYVLLAVLTGQYYTINLTD
jgi:hypothetical protein